MSNLSNVNKLRRLEEEIKRKESLAKDFKAKGMSSSYGSCMNELSMLKQELRKRNTDLTRPV